MKFKIASIVITARNKLIKIIAPIFERLKLFIVPHPTGMRPAIEFIKLKLQGELLGLEVGVYLGDNARNILVNLPLKKLYLVDSYELIKIEKENIKPSIYTLPSNLIVKDPNFSGLLIDFRKCYSIAKKNLEPFENKIEFIRKRSIDAVNDIPNELDFIYIDADHDYLPVLNDIKLYYPKLKKGGIISGDDFSAEYNGVAKAVLEFASENNLKILGRGMDWWIIKN